MAEKERGQNPTIGDSVKLRLFTYNSNNLADLVAINGIDVYFLDPENTSAENPDGRRIVQSYTDADVTTEDTGTYRLDVELEEVTFTIGEYRDVWTVTASEDQPAHSIEQLFKVYPSLWYSTPIPPVYDFSFHFQPNKLRKGSKQYLIIEVKPNVPTAGDLRRYYENLAIVSDMKLSMEQVCGDCLPEEADLRLILDEVSITYREKRYGYYQLDTTDMDCGLYDVWFKLEFGTSIYISDRLKFQIFD